MYQIKMNGYLERADSRTRDASRNYKLKSAKSELYKHPFFINTPKIWNQLPSVIKDRQSLEHFKTAIVLVMSHQIWSRTPRRDTFVGFCLYEEDRHEVANRPSHKRPRIDGICITTLVNCHERPRTTNRHESTAFAQHTSILHVCVMVRVREVQHFRSIFKT